MSHLIKFMSESPNIYLNDPDPLSVLLKRLSLNAEVYVNGDFCGTWAVDTSGSRRIPFHLIGKGEAWLHMGDEKHKLDARDLVIFPHDHQHIIANSAATPKPHLINAPMSNDGETTNMVCGFFEFKNTLINPLLDAMPSVIHLPATPSNSKALALIDLMIMELSESRAGCYTVVDQLAYLLFVEVLRVQVESGKLQSGLLVALFDSRIGSALNAIHQQPEHNWNLAQLAEKAAMSRSNFADKFSKLVGSSPMNYLVKWRMINARKLLITSDLSIAQIAEQSGYESEAAFRKAYKQHQGHAPGSVRSGAH
ncbi:AraC family transcriptional regulator [Pseudoalteromonas sp. MMG024]|uniref:AraC family transcriptional regulator n=1 Tax=Pseudoalteromonas sp. MMG024 TaxID=2909980 RepID=UPI001F3A4520|nr:AraC family transcriptional regulator [Pseudoalteromonas sp. MMG024]MCF6457393.1 AraC family transcriptional regulator [Pseudoalteromonas sp. MMG024]